MRKTHTSTEVKRRYNEKVYTRIATQIPKELAQRFKDKCAAEGKPQRQVIIAMIEEYVNR